MHASRAKKLHREPRDMQSGREHRMDPALRQCSRSEQKKFCDLYHAIRLCDPGVKTMSAART